MRKLMTELRRQALLMMVGVLLLNGIAIYLLQKQQIQQHNQSVAAVLATELATPDLTPGRLVALRDALQLSAIAVTSQASEAPQLQSRSDASDWLKYLYPELQGEILLSQPGQKALYTLSQEGLLTSALLQGGVLTITLLLALFGILAIQRRHYEQVTASLIHEIVETEGSDHCVSSEISTALQNMRDLQQTQLTNVTQQVAQLELIINQDALTGVLNRSTFNQDLTQALTSTSQTGLSLLAIVRATELTAINQRHGHVAGDKYLQTIANLITRASKKLPNAKVYRLAGSDFAILQSQSNNNQAQLLGHELKMLFDHYLNEEEFESVAYVGLTLCRPGQQVEQVMGRGDLALAKAQTSIVNGWCFQEKDVEDYLQGEAHWKRVITDVIARQAILLMQQPIQSMNISIKSYNEIFARFVGENEQVMPTETLLAMAQRHDLLGQLERICSAGRR